MSVVETEPPLELEPGTFAARLYDSVAPLAARDAENGWALLILCNTIGTMFQLVEELVRDTADGPGWSLLMDVERCPPAALPWLGQFAGVRLYPGSDETEMRARIASTDGFRRGTPEAIRSAVRATLDPGGTVVFRERDGDPYHLTVITYASETPDESVTALAALAAKPGGLTLDYHTNPGQDWLQVRTGHPNWTDVKADYPDWIAVRVDQPPG